MNLLRFVVVAFCISLFVPASADDLPAPLDTALSEAEANDKMRFSYTQTFTWVGTEPIVERFDAATKKWTLISGSPDNLPKKARKKHKNWRKGESIPGGLLYADYRSSFKNIQLTEETEETLFYSFTAGQADSDKLDENPGDNIFTQTTVRKDDNTMTSYQIKALQGFKPNPVSRLDEFVFEQFFDRPDPTLPAVMTKVYWRAKGKQMMSSVDEEFTITYSDFEVLK